jgi:hypothetical protein
MSDSIRLGILFVFVIAAATCGLLSTLVLQRVVSEVNSQLPPDRRYYPYWWHGIKYWRVLRDYRRLYPSGVLVRQLHALATVMAIAFAFAVFAVSLSAFAALFAGGAMVTWIWALHRW